MFVPMILYKSAPVLISVSPFMYPLFMPLFYWCAPVLSSVPPLYAPCVCPYYTDAPLAEFGVLLMCPLCSPLCYWCASVLNSVPHFVAPCVCPYATDAPLCLILRPCLIWKYAYHQGILTARKTATSTIPGSLPLVHPTPSPSTTIYYTTYN